MTEKKTNWKSPLLLLTTAFIWGIAFVAQSAGMEYVGPFTFGAARSLLAVIFLTAMLPVLDHIRGKDKKEWQALTKEERAKQRRLLLTAGIVSGLFLCSATDFQQFALITVSAGKAGFMTALYIILVPILGIFFHRRCGLHVWVSVVIAVTGLYFLCIKEGEDFGSLEKADFLLLFCSLLFSFQIMTIDHFTGLVDGVRMSLVQFCVCTIVNTILMVCFEQPRIENLLGAAVPILYAGIFSSGIAYTLQILGQKGMNPTVASLIMSLESVISVLAGFVLLGQTLTRREILGCVIMFAAILLAQLPEKKEA